MLEGSVRAAVVVLLAERLEEGLELGDGGRLVGLGAEPFLHRLLESLGFAAGGGVAGSGVLLGDVESLQLCLEGGAATLAAVAGVPDGVDHCRCR